MMRSIIDNKQRTNNNITHSQIESNISDYLSKFESFLKYNNNINNFSIGDQKVLINRRNMGTRQG
jgi:hypothetical protein